MNKQTVAIHIYYRKDGKKMETITSFTVDHMRLLPGVYVSRKDSTGQDIVTTFDIRMTRPNYEPVMNTAEIHTIHDLLPTLGEKAMRRNVAFAVRMIADVANAAVLPVKRGMSDDMKKELDKYFHREERDAKG